MQDDPVDETNQVRDLVSVWLNAKPNWTSTPHVQGHPMCITFVGCPTQEHLDWLRAEALTLGFTPDCTIFSRLGFFHFGVVIDSRIREVHPPYTHHTYAAVKQLLELFAAVVAIRELTGD